MNLKEIKISESAKYVFYYKLEYYTAIFQTKEHLDVFTAFICSNYSTLNNELLRSFYLINPTNEI